MTAAQKLNQTNTDQAVYQQQVDECDPQAALRRRIKKAIDENTAWINAHRTQQQTILVEFAEEKVTIQRLTDSIRPLKEYIETLIKEKEALAKSALGREQAERKHRRQFLDGDPQSGVGGLPGVRTNDDRVLLGLWITLGAAVATTALLLLRARGVSAANWKALTLVSVLALVIAFILVRAIVSWFA